jgi:hypothetical protein
MLSSALLMGLVSALVVASGPTGRTGERPKIVALGDSITSGPASAEIGPTRR